jgi:preprotein translocase subunit SecE
VAASGTALADKIKLAIAALIVVAAVWGFYYLGARPLIVRIGAILLGVVLAGAAGWMTEPGKRFYAYCQESIAEAKKVVWPTRKEAMQTTALVMGFVIVMALFLWIVDAALALGLQLLLGRGA